jgi:AraC family transcriptional regulator
MISQAVLNTGRPEAPVSFDLSLVAPALSKLLNDASSAVGRDTSILRSCIEQAQALLRNRDTTDDRGTPSTPRRGGLAPWQALRVKAFVRENIDGPIRVGDLAGVSRLSTSYFSLAFRRTFGVSVQTYVVRLRIERAQMLLLSTDQPLSHVSLECGFCDQAHLCRQFRRIVGRTPASWRREHITSLAA